MKPKYICLYKNSFPKTLGNACHDASFLAECADFNRTLCHSLQSYKNQITQYAKNQLWDSLKKYGNEYEYVNHCYSTPVSRSYYKLWEILQDFPLIPAKSRGIRTCHLAEGPGGFIESLINYCACQDVTIDQIFGITLQSSDRRVPCWKLREQFIKKHNITLSSGADGTGDLYRLENVDAFINEVGTERCELVTGDGGFDFSRDFNKQESNFSRLLAAEIYVAVRVQKKGGSFVLKIFDVFEETTVQLLYTLSVFYDTMRIVKPYTSRPANGERYVICQGFRTHECQIPHLRFLRESLYLGDPSKHLEKTLAPDREFRIMVLEMNTVYTYLQIAAICRTLLYITMCKSCPPYFFDRKLDQVYNRQLLARQEWFSHYGAADSFSTIGLTNASTNS